MSNIQSGDMAYRNQGEFIYDVYVRTLDGLGQLCHTAYEQDARVFLCHEQEIHLEKILGGLALRFQQPIKVRVKLDATTNENFQRAQILQTRLTKHWKVDVVRGVV
jgi:hypothetical protein